MSFVKCFDVVSMVAEEASEQFGAAWHVNKEKERVLKKDCLAIDSLAEEFNGVSFEVDIDDVVMDITVSLVCGEVVIENTSHKLYDILHHTKKFSVRKVDDSSIQLDFVFPGIWDKTY